MDALLGELAAAMLRVLAGTVLHHLDALAAARLLLAVPGYHVKLPDAVLVHRQRHADAVLFGQHHCGGADCVWLTNNYTGTGWRANQRREPTHKYYILVPEGCRAYHNKRAR